MPKDLVVLKGSKKLDATPVLSNIGTAIFINDKHSSLGFQRA